MIKKLLISLFITAIFQSCGPSIKEHQSVEPTKGIVQKSIVSETMDKEVLDKYMRSHVEPNKDIYFFFYKEAALCPDLTKGKSEIEVNNIICNNPAIPTISCQYVNKQHDIFFWSCAKWEEIKFKKIFFGS